MARGSRIVDEQHVVQDVDDFYVSYGGQSMQIGSAFVAEYGVVRQFWPPTIISESGIVMDTATEETYSSQAAPARAFAIYDARTGQLYFNDGDNDTYRIVEAINPAPRSQGLFLFKFDIISGDIVSNNDPIGSWVDVNSEGTLGVKAYYLENKDVGEITGQATISFAEDDGAGGPQAGTLVSKTVNFTAQVQPDRISMTTRPWNLDNIEYNQKAEAAIVVIPANWYDPVNNTNVTDAYITGEYGAPKGIVEAEIYTPSWGPDITVQADLIAGDASNFEADAVFGLAQSTSVRRRWVLRATNEGDAFTATVDITISDGIQSVTKRVAMRAENRGENVPPGSGVEDDFTEQLTINDIVFFIQPLPPRYPGGRIEVYRVGNMNAFYVSDGSQVRPNYPQKWHLESPSATDPNNYEGRMVKVSGSDLTLNVAGIWQNLNSNRVWELAITEQDWADRPDGIVEKISKNAEYLLEIREVGRPDTVRQKRIFFSLELEENVNDLGEPPSGLE